VSRKADIERAIRGDIFRNGHLVQIEPGEKFDATKYGDLMLKCGKCNHIFSERMAQLHLELCQPAGAHCSYCGKIVLPHEFVAHIKECMKKKTLGVKNA
jgi:phage FluMu protein Com